MTTDIERATLYTLSDQYKTAADLLAAEFDPDDPDQSAAVMATLDEIGGLLRHKVESIAGLIRDLDRQADCAETDAAWVAQEAKRLAGRAAARRARADWLRGYAMREIENAGLDRVETDRYSISIRTNPPSVVITDPSAVPHEFERTKIEVTVDKRAILDHMKATGEVVPGTTVTRARRLEVR